MAIEPIKVREAHGGFQKLYRFPNNYGASVVKFPGSYGSEKDLWELAIIKWFGDNYEICYDTGITNDVMGNLTEDDIQKILLEIELYPL